VPPPQPAATSGCLKWLAIGCTALVVLCGIGILGLVFFVFGAIKHSDVYRQALSRASSDPRVVEALGTPIEPGWWVSGSVNANNGEGTANINFPVSGPKGSARIHAAASRDNDAWSYSSIVVRPEKGGEIDVLHH
jgi:hypothetical protein